MQLLIISVVCTSRTINTLHAIALSNYHSNRTGFQELTDRCYITHIGLSKCGILWVGLNYTKRMRSGKCLLQRMKSKLY